MVSNFLDRLILVFFFFPRLTLASAIAVTLKSVAGEPVVAPARLALTAVRAVATLLTLDVIAVEETLLEAVLSGLFLGVCGQVIRVQELVDEFLVLADAVGEHASVVPIVVHTPFHLNNFARLVRDDGLLAPRLSRLVVVHADPGVITAWAIATNLRSIQIRPGGDGFLDGTFRAGVGASLWYLVRS